MKRVRFRSWFAGIAVVCALASVSLMAQGANEKKQKEPVTEEEAIPESWKEIVEKYLAFREEAWPMIIPATEGEVFGSWDSIIANIGKRIVCGWFWYFQGGEIRVEKGALPARKEPDPVEVVIYEDIYNSRVVVLGMAEGEKPRELYSRKVLPILDYVDDDYSLEAEISMRRLAIRLTALPFNYIVPKKDIQLFDFAATKSLVPMRMMSGEYPADKIWLEIKKHDEQPNHFAGLTIHAPTSSVSRLDVFANSDLLDPTAWSLLVDAQSLNEEGLLAFTNTIVNFSKRYFLAANADAHSDDDGLSDGRERFLYFTSPYDEDTDGDSLPDNWEIQYGLDPLDNGTINTNNGAIGDPDGDGFSNVTEWQQGAPPNNSAWNGEQLVWKLMNCTTGRPLRSGSETNHSLWVEVENSANCGGPNGEIQVETMTFHVGDLLDCGYFVDIEVEGAVEDERSTFDKVYVTTYQEEYYFEGSDNDNGCNMTNKTAIRNHLILPNSDVVLKYDTVGWMYHVGGYAEIINATTTGTLRISFAQNDYNFCASDGSASIDIQTEGFKPDDISWSLEGIVTGTGTRVSFDPSSLQSCDHPLTAESTEFPCLWASCNVKIHNVQFDSNEVFRCWFPNGTYAAAANLHPDSYDSSDFSWSVQTLAGDATATINPKTGLLSFGTQSGGKYRIIAEAPAGNCFDEMTLTLIRVELEYSNASIENPKEFQYGKTTVLSPCYLNPESVNVEALVVYFKDVAIYLPGDIAEIADFSISLNLYPAVLQNIQWAKYSGPDSGTLLDADEVAAEFLNPKKGGVYQFDVFCAGKTTRTQLWFPIAGPDISYYWQNEINYLKNTWAPAYRAALNSRTTSYILRPDMRLLIKHSFALEDMADIGGSLDWTGFVQGTETPCGGPNRLGDEFRETMHGIVIDFRKRNNMLYALIGKEMGLTTLELYVGPNTPWAVGSPDSEATQESYRAGFDLFEGNSLEEVMINRGYSMQEPGSWSQKEWPSYEISQGSLTRAGAARLEELIQ